MLTFTAITFTLQGTVKRKAVCKIAILKIRNKVPLHRQVKAGFVLQIGKKI